MIESAQVLRRSLCSCKRVCSSQMIGETVGEYVEIEGSRGS